MLRSMYSGVAGLKSHQIRMDVIGNNIANVNTTGFKKSRVNFYDTLYQVSKGPSAPTTNRGGVNGQAVGLGVAVASIDTITTSGGTQTTNKMSDLMINGNGYFILQGNTPQDLYYTRAGNFDFDPTGRFVNTSNGMQVMGYIYDTITMKLRQNMEAININSLKSMGAKETSALFMENNLDARKTSLDTPHPITQKIFDSLGIEHNLTMLCSKASTSIGPASLTMNAAGHYCEWPLVSGVSAIAEYEYSLDGGKTWTTCSATDPTHPVSISGGNARLALESTQNYTGSNVMVRVREDVASGRPASNAVAADADYTGTGTSADATLAVTSNSLTITPTAGNAANDYQYSLDGGRTWIDITDGNLTQNFTDGYYPAGSIKIRLIDDGSGQPSGTVESTAAVGTPPTGLALTTAVPANVWRIDMAVDGTPYSGTGVYVFFDTNGKYLGFRTENGGTWSSAPPTAFENNTFTINNIDYSATGATPGSITIDFTSLTQYGKESGAWAGKTDASNPEGKGYGPGQLDSYTIDQYGVITGIYSNGITRTLAQLQTAVFDNPAGLTAAGQNLFRESINSGSAQITEKIGEGSHGEVSPGTLEMSNVDLSEEFTNMIVTQRGFQANSRIITTSDQMLEELLSLKR